MGYYDRDTILTSNTYLSLVMSATDRFVIAGISTARLDAEVLVSFVARFDRTALMTRWDETVDADAVLFFDELVARREQREPVAYLTGEKEFYGRSFMVSPDVLIPRPETELLVEKALALYAGDQHIGVCDMGTGSGAIAITLAAERPSWRISATDISRDALTMAQKNAGQIGVSDHIVFFYSDLFAALAGQWFDLITFNPPYIAEGDAMVSPDTNQYEPHLALYAGATGLDLIETFIKQLPDHLSTGGHLLMEIGYDQRDAVRRLVENTAGLLFIECLCDLAGIDRIIVAARN